MNRTLKEETVERYYTKPMASCAATWPICNRLKPWPQAQDTEGTLYYEYICGIWKKEPDRFTLDPIHQMPGLNT
jgi:hypothetical protein